MNKNPKKRSLSKELLVMIILLSVIALLITLANVNALQNISRFTGRISSASEKYNIAIESGNMDEIEDAQADLALAIKQTNTRIQGTYKFDTVLVVVIIIIAAVCMVIINRFIAKPARQAKQDLDEIIGGFREGKGDLSLRLYDKTEDEIGQLATGMNQFMGVLQTLIGKISKASEDITESVRLVSISADSSGDSVGNVSAATEELAASMEEISATLQELTYNCNEVVAEVGKISSHASGASSELQRVRDKAEESHKNAVSSKENTIHEFSEMQSIVENCVEGAKAVNQINELTDNILNIAAQTNLLALNASIEAARAGDAGKGFAVVADEIRKLADSSRETAEHIQNVSNLVVDAVTKLSDSASGMLNFVNEEVVTDYDAFVEIISEYKDNSQRVSQTFSTFAGMAENASTSMKAMNSQINDVSATVEESASSVTSVANEMSYIVEIISNINTQISQNKVISEGLHDEVSRFENA